MNEPDPLPPRILPYGDRAVLVELASPAQVHAYAAALRAIPGISESVPGARTVLVMVEHPEALDELCPQLRELRFEAEQDQPEAAEVRIPVVYDGADLSEVCALTSLSVQEVITRHTAGTYVADFLGFAPGFAYLSGLDPALQVPRRATPRTHVPAGAVAIAGAYSAIYPRSSPGGWQLIGHTEATIFDADDEVPALFRAGTRVRFEAVDQ